MLTASLAKSCMCSKKSTTTTVLQEADQDQQLLVACPTLRMLVLQTLIDLSLISPIRHPRLTTIYGLDLLDLWVMFAMQRPKKTPGSTILRHLQGEILIVATSLNGDPEWHCQNMNVDPGHGDNRNVVRCHHVSALGQRECTTTQLERGKNLDACIQMPLMMMTTSSLRNKPPSGSSRTTFDILHPAKEHLRALMQIRSALDARIQAFTLVLQQFGFCMHACT